MHKSDTNSNVWQIYLLDIVIIENTFCFCFLVYDCKGKCQIKIAEMIHISLQNSLLKD